MQLLSLPKASNDRFVFDSPLPIVETRTFVIVRRRRDFSKLHVHYVRVATDLKGDWIQWKQVKQSEMVGDRIRGLLEKLNA